MPPAGRSEAVWHGMTQKYHSPLSRFPAPSPPCARCFHRHESQHRGTWKVSFVSLQARRPPRSGVLGQSPLALCRSQPPLPFSRQLLLLHAKEHHSRRTKHGRWNVQSLSLEILTAAEGYERFVLLKICVCSNAECPEGGAIMRSSCLSSRRIRTQVQGDLGSPAVSILQWHHQTHHVKLWLEKAQHLKSNQMRRENAHAPASHPKAQTDRGREAAHPSSLDAQRQQWMSQEEVLIQWGWHQTTGWLQLEAC